MENLMVTTEFIMLLQNCDDYKSLPKTVLFAERFTIIFWANKFKAKVVDYGNYPVFGK